MHERMDPSRLRVPRRRIPCITHLHPAFDHRTGVEPPVGRKGHWRGGGERVRLRVPRIFERRVGLITHPVVPDVYLGRIGLDAVWRRRRECAVWLVGAAA